MSTYSTVGTELENLTPILAPHFERLGMKMHVGSNNTKLKTEAMFSRAP
jgi:hypothetical protein